MIKQFISDLLFKFVESDNSGKSSVIEINDSVLSFLKEPLITALVPIKAYVDMIESEQFGKVNEIQKEKLYIIQKQVDNLLFKINNISIKKIHEIKRK